MDCAFNDVFVSKYRNSIQIESGNCDKNGDEEPKEFYLFSQIKTWNKLCLLFWAKKNAKTIAYILCINFSNINSN